MAQCMLTTTDNPYDPFEQFDEWYAFDTQKGYNTCSYLARLTDTSHDMSELDYEQSVEQAIDDIIEMNLTGNYKKVYQK